MNLLIEMDDQMPDTTVVIPKHQASFRMDGDGRWHNKDGPFRHKRVIRHFNAAIDKDEMGYFVTQQRGETKEKVYFPYEETALFVVEVLWPDPLRLKLNTGRKEILDPRCLFISGDHLYYQLENGTAKFNQRTLLSISDSLSFEEEKYYFNFDSIRISIEERPLEP